ncbi:MAG TPA: NAD(P)/FAD-dependent oxidoreductase [Terracidiphilus sp.]|nr:NAD(P)/FAD-dependent oxidoreductase [Terracidiphilus sp.]
MSQRQSIVECLVIGGGLAGSMTGVRLAAAGREVMVVERERAAHDKVCGEFLSPEAVGYLRQEGIDARDLGAAEIDWLRFLSGNRVSDVRLPFTALSLSRRALDEALLTRAARLGCEVQRGIAVERLMRAGGAWVAEMGDGSAVNARHVILATGKHDLRGWKRSGSAQDDLVAFKLHWALAPEQLAKLRGAMELYLFRGGYGGMSLIESDSATLCLVVRKAVLRRWGGWTQLLKQIRAENTRVRERLEGARPLWERPIAISAIPYGYFANDSAGIWRVGDQAAVIPSFTGDGMSIALHSAALAAQMLIDGKSPDEHCAALRLQLRNGMRIATRISRMLVTRSGSVIAAAAMGLVPQAMRWIAAGTRIPAEAMKHAEGGMHGHEGAIV